MRGTRVAAGLALFLALTGTSLTAPYVETPVADSEVSVIPDPYGVAPLTALVVVRSSAGIPEQSVHRVDVTVQGTDGSTMRWSLPYGSAGFTTNFDTSGLDQVQAEDIVVPVLGLQPDSTNRVSITIFDDQSRRAYVCAAAVDTRVVTDRGDPLRDGYPEVTVSAADPGRVEPGMTLVSFSMGDRGRFVTRPFVIDRRGTLRWVLKLDSLRNWASPVERLENGNLLLGRGGYVYEYSMLGRQVHAWDIGRYGFTQHHDIHEIRSGAHRGDLLVAVDRMSGTTVEDVVIEIDRNGALVDSWDMRNLLDVDRGVVLKNPKDWLHMNAVAYDPRDESLIISGRNQGVVKVDRRHRLRWILAPHRGWGKAGADGNGPETGSALLTAISANGEPYPEAVQVGHADVADGTEFDWPWGQHAVELLGNGDLAMFDNGFNRLFKGQKAGASRAVEYRVDESHHTVRQVWEYGEGRGSDYYSSIISDVDSLPVTGNRLVTSGSIRNSSNGPHAYVTEITYPGGEVVFEARIGFRDAHSDLKAGGWGNMDIVYRAERLSLYPGIEGHSD